MFNNDANTRADAFLKDEFIPAIINEIEDDLNIKIDCYQTLRLGKQIKPIELFCQIEIAIVCYNFNYELTQ